MTVLIGALSLALATIAACTPPQVDAPPSAPPPTVRTAQETGCFSASECSAGELCVDPRYPVCGNVPACEDGGIQCGCACVTACTATSCAADEVCGASGCCEPRPCASEAQCSTAGSRCLAGRCVRRGTCGLPPP
jgi:hypothetical protein